MDKNDKRSIRDLVNDNTLFTTAEGPGDIYYEPFIEDGKVGFYIRDHHGREDCIYLEPCDNEPLVWVHLHDPSEEGDPVSFQTLCQGWPAEGWQVVVDGKPQGAIHTDPIEAEGHADGLRRIPHDHEREIEVVSKPFN